MKNIKNIHPNDVVNTMKQENSVFAVDNIDMVFIDLYYEDFDTIMKICKDKSFGFFIVEEVEEK